MQAHWQGPLFVVGVWRSGTSLLYALLNKHPLIGLMYEADLFLLKPLFRIPTAGSRRLTRWQFWNDALKRHKLDFDRSRVPLDISCLQTAMGNIYRQYARQKGAVIYGEKSPNYYGYLTTLSQGFSDARFIIIWRDLRAICRSLIRGAAESPWFGRRGMTHRALIAYRVLKTECDRLVSRGVPIHQIQYEDLVRDPGGAMVEICGFLGVPFVPAVASLDGADRSAIYQGEHHSLVRGERIVSSLERAEVLPSNLQRKIARYVSLWREESGGKWPVVLSENDHLGSPSHWERVFDQVLYCGLRVLDSVVVFIYCCAPLSLLKRFRDFKSQRRTRIPKRPCQTRS